MRLLTLAACVLLACSSELAAQVDDTPTPDCTLPAVYDSGTNTWTITGNVPTGNYNFANADVLIYDAFLYQCSGRTFTLTVSNGSIAVGSGLVHTAGIVGSATHGQRGAAGSNCVAPGDATAPGQPFNVVLVTTAGAGTRSANIGLAEGIDCSGGNGGDGRDGPSEYWDPITCAHCSAQSGKLGTAGSDGGSVTIMSAGDISIADGISVNGGNGGSGGSAGAGSKFSAGLAAAGRRGGNAGTIFISHTDEAPDDAICAIHGGQYGKPSTCHYGYLHADGGLGGAGGHGATGHSASAGADAGAGGTGGSITIDVRTLIVAGPNVVGPGIVCQGPATVTVRGGQGGIGGRGAVAATSGGIFECDPSCFSGAQGTVGGLGGVGGNGGTISVSASDTFSVGTFNEESGGYLSSNGGDGGMTGRAGDGTYDGCPCTGTGFWCPGVYPAGASRTSANGGVAGPITVAAGSVLNCYEYGSIIARGGVGGDGPEGGDPGAACCYDCDDPYSGGSPIYAASQVGGNGGSSGNSSNIYLSFGTRTGYANFYVCSPAGGVGGKGGRGNPAGALGGWNGGWGAGGKLFYNGVQQLVACGIGFPQRGPSGDVIDLQCNISE